MTILPYPDELKYLYEKGDSIVFAKIGIPSITVSPGFGEINEELLKFVHQPIDEADDQFDYDYLPKFSVVYSKISNYISNCEAIPYWKSDSKYCKN